MAALDLKIETGFATLPLPGEVESGDLSLVKRVGKGTLIAVVDGLGHGQEAASSAHAAIAALERYAREPLADLVRPTAGFVGAEQPHPTSRVVPLTPGDTVVLFSDGIRDGFADSLTLPDTPQSIADFIITRHVKGTDDALVLVARYAR